MKKLLQDPDASPGYMRDGDSNAALRRTSLSPVLLVVLALILLGLTPSARAAGSATDNDVAIPLEGWVVAPSDLLDCGSKAWVAFGEWIPTRPGADNDSGKAAHSFLMHTPFMVRPVPAYRAGDEMALPGASKGLWEDAYGNVWCGGQCVSSQACCRVIVDTSTPTDSPRPPAPPRPRP